MPFVSVTQAAGDNVLCLFRWLAYRQPKLSVINIWSLIILFPSFVEDEDDCEDEKVDSFQISPWSCLCNIFRSTEPLQTEPDDFRFTTCSVQSMDISTPEPNTGQCYLPDAVDGTGIATKKFLDSHGQLSKLNPDERERLKDSRVVMKAYLISKLVAARYTFEDGSMTFNERAEDNHIDVMEYKERTQNMYDLLYAGQISVDTRATKRQQRVALKRLKKSNLNLRPSKIRELAKQMKKEAETQKEEADTISSGVDSGTYDLSKAESNDSDKQGMFDLHSPIWSVPPTTDTNRAFLGETTISSAGF